MGINSAKEPAKQTLEAANAFSNIADSVNAAIESSNAALAKADELTQVSSNLKQKAEQAATRTDTIYTDATENKRQLNEDIIPGIERAMADVEGVAAKNKMV